MTTRRKNPYLGKSLRTYVRERSARDPAFADALRVEAEKRAIAQQLRELRVALGMTQQQVAERSGRPQATIARLEKGEVEPRFDLLNRVAEALGVRVEIHLVPVTGH